MFILSFFRCPSLSPSDWQRPMHGIYSVCLRSSQAIMFAQGNYLASIIPPRMSRGKCRGHEGGPWPTSPGAPAHHCVLRLVGEGDLLPSAPWDRRKERWQGRLRQSKRGAADWMEVREAALSSHHLPRFGHLIPSRWRQGTGPRVEFTTGPMAPGHQGDKEQLCTSGCGAGMKAAG